MFSFKYIVLKSDRPRAQYTIRLEVLKKIITIVIKELSVEIVDIATFPHKNVYFTTLK